ncbi:MAG: DUF1731 domain-containing protein, partial [Verrucomicrobiales bacterium]
MDFVEKEAWVDGVVNLTAPEAPTNAATMSAFREWGSMPVGLPASRWMLALGASLLGTEMELVTKSRWVEPRRLRELGFKWRWPELRGALGDLKQRPGIDGFFAVPGRRAVGVRGWV